MNNTLIHINPVLLNYKTFSFSVTEKEDGINIEIASKHIIHTSYNPKSDKGFQLNSKIIFSASERNGTKDNGLNLHLTLNNELGWYVSLYETDNCININLVTGEYIFTIDNTTKLMTNNTKLYSMTARIFKE